MEVEREIADADGNWKRYDVCFRILVSQGQVEFGDNHIALYVNARLDAFMYNSQLLVESPEKPDYSERCLLFISFR